VGWGEGLTVCLVDVILGGDSFLLEKILLPGVGWRLTVRDRHPRVGGISLGELSLNS
jgi:hypothetical protein